jgi:hypothetical protein
MSGKRRTRSTVSQIESEPKFGWTIVLSAFAQAVIREAFEALIRFLGRGGPL